MSTCFFIGHQDAPDTIRPKLQEVLDILVTKKHVTDFIVGHYGNFDRMAISTIQQTIIRYPEKELLAELLEPYFLDGIQRPLPHYFDGFYYPEGLESVPKRYCIEKANQLALDQADFLVTYVCRESGNAAKLLRRAKRMAKIGHLSIINLAEAP